MKLSTARIEFLTPIVKHLARQFEPQAIAAAGLTAEDLEQEAWLKLCQSKAPPRKLDKPDQWFSTVIRRHFIDIVNRGKTRISPYFSGELEEYDQEEMPPVEPSLSDRIRAQNAINWLPSMRQRLILRARYGIGRDAPETVGQIARDLGISKRWVQKETQAGLNSIKAMFRCSPS